MKIKKLKASFSFILSYLLSLISKKEPVTQLIGRYYNLISAVLNYHMQYHEFGSTHSEREENKLHVDKLIHYLDMSSMKEIKCTVYIYYACIRLRSLQPYA